jgi:5'-nucleotidase
MSSKKPLILITNDDGYQAKGILSLVEALKDLGDIIVFAPSMHQSGMSSAITSSIPLRARLHKTEDNVTTYICNGTPVDCVKLAFDSFLDRKPDLLVSGINHGSNSAISVLYSGTMGATIEGCIFGVPSFGMSLTDFKSDADFTGAQQVAHAVAEQVLQNGLPESICLNVNVPKGQVKGIKITKQTPGKWVNEFVKSEDPSGRSIYWLTGQFDNKAPDNQDTDEWALTNGYAAIVPVKIDMTAHDYIPILKKWKF